MKNLIHTGVYRSVLQIAVEILPRTECFGVVFVSFDLTDRHSVTFSEERGEADYRLELAGTQDLIFIVPHHANQAVPCGIVPRVRVARI